MVLVYVRNSELSHIRSSIEDIVGDPDYRWRNPTHYNGEVETCDKVYIYGKHNDVERTYKKADVPVEHITYQGETVAATEDSKTPSMDWNKDQLIEVAQANGIDVDRRYSKESILEKIHETGNSG